MKRVITALLAALLALSLAACGSRVETKKLAGTWTCTIDVTDRMNAAAEQALGLSAADGTAQMPLQLVLTVTEDGAYTLRYDSDAARSAALTGYCRAEGGQLYLADTAADLTETADCLSYTLSDGTMTWTDAQGELSSQLTEQEQELLRVPLTWTKQEESK